MAHIYRRRAFRFTYRGPFSYTGLSFASPEIFGPTIFPSTDNAEVLKSLEEKKELYRKIKTSERHQNGFVKADDSKTEKKGQKRYALGSFLAFGWLLICFPFFSDWNGGFKPRPQQPQFQQMAFPLQQMAFQQAQAAQPRYQQPPQAQGLMGAAPLAVQQPFFFPAQPAWSNRAPYYPGKKGNKWKGKNKNSKSQ
jgi:hypothetical protein